MSRRIKYPAVDENHKLVSAVMKDVYGAFFEYGAWYANYRRHKIVAIDTSKHGGSMLDWIVLVDKAALFIEIKMPEKRDTLTDGERYFFANSRAHRFVVTTEQEFVDLLTNVMELK